jgi:hypothetical protein
MSWENQTISEPARLGGNKARNLRRLMAANVLLLKAEVELHYGAQRNDKNAGCRDF